MINTVVLTKIKFRNYKYRSHLKVLVKFKITLFFKMIECKFN